MWELLLVIGLPLLIGIATLAHMRWASFPIILNLTRREARELTTARTRALRESGARGRGRSKGALLYSGTFHGLRGKVYANGVYAPFGVYDFKSVARRRASLLLPKTPWAHQLVMRYAYVDFDDIVAIGRVDMLWTIMDELGMRRDIECAGVQLETSDVRVCVMFGGTELVPFVRALQSAMGARWFDAMERGGEVRGVLKSQAVLRGGWGTSAGPVHMRIGGGRHDDVHIPRGWARFSITTSTNIAHGDLFKHSLLRLGPPTDASAPRAPAYIQAVPVEEVDGSQVDWY